MISTMSKNQRKRQIEKLFARHIAAVEQAVEVAGSRRGQKIASGVIDQIEAMQADISRQFSELLEQVEYLPSVKFEIKQKLDEQVNFLEALQAAVKVEPEKAKNFPACFRMSPQQRRQNNITGKSI
jgi:hypothetical protein